MSSLSLRGIRKTFGNTTVLHGIDLEVRDGEFVVFVGPSGCGKSTLLRCIAGLEDVDAGELQIDGKPMNDVPPAQRGLALGVPSMRRPNDMFSATVMCGYSA